MAGSNVEKSNKPLGISLVDQIYPLVKQIDLKNKPERSLALLAVIPLSPAHLLPEEKIDSEPRRNLRLNTEYYIQAEPSLEYVGITTQVLRIR